MGRVHQFGIGVLVTATLGAGHPALANFPPNPPSWIEPQPGSIVSAFDPHLNVHAFVDPDSADTHAESDFEIWDDSLGVRAWAALGIDDPTLLYHVHFGDGNPEGPLEGETRLDFDRAYRVRARFRDSSGESNSWSEWSAWVPFRTAAAAQILPMSLEDLLPITPVWNTQAEDSLVLPAGGFLLLEGGGTPLLLIEGTVLGNSVLDFPSLDGHAPVRATLGALLPGVWTPASRLTVVDEDSLSRDIYLPPVELEMGETIVLWIDDRGRSYYADPQDSLPTFSRLAQDVFNPWALNLPGFRVERVATNLFLPVNIAFASPKRTGPHDPFFYVTELYGKVKVVTHDLSVFTYAEGLLNFEPNGDFPGAGEMGITGLCVEPQSGDLFVTGVYDAGSGPKLNRVMRLVSSADGLSAESTLVILNGIPSAPSHQIQEASIGPDGKLYVQVADGLSADTTVGQNPADLRAKVLRMNLDGSAPGDNPYGPQSVVWAVGFRNPFGGDWSRSGRLYVTDNGPDANDRVAHVVAGGDYGWCCDMTQGALALFPNSGITGLAVAPPGGWDPAFEENLFVGFSGPTYAPGDPGGNAKRIRRIVLAGADSVVAETQFLKYAGAGYGTIAGLAFGPDGLYFSDLYGEGGFDEDGVTRANIYRIRRIPGIGQGEKEEDLAARRDAAARAKAQRAPTALPATLFWDRASGSTSVRFTLEQPTRVSLCVYDVSGRLARSLTDDWSPAGAHAVTWDGRGDAGEMLASGIYLLRLATDAGRSETARVLLLR